MASCIFMDIAKKYGVDYGDVLMATEAYRPGAILANFTLVYQACARLDETRNGGWLQRDIEDACHRRWGEEA